MSNDRTSLFGSSIDRRKFLKASAALAGAVAGGDYFFKTQTADAQVLGENPPDPLETEGEVRIRYSVCQMCHSRCGVRAKVQDRASPETSRPTRLWPLGGGLVG